MQHDALEQAEVNTYRLEQLARMLEAMPGGPHDLVHSRHVRGVAGVLDAVLGQVEDAVSRVQVPDDAVPGAMTRVQADIVRLRALVQLMEGMGGGSGDQVGVDTLRGTGGVIAGTLAVIQAGLSELRVELQKAA